MEKDGGAVKEEDEGQKSGEVQQGRWKKLKQNEREGGQVGD